MLKNDIDELKERAAKFTRQLDQAADDCGLMIVRLVEGELVFIDKASGLQCSASLVTPGPDHGAVEPVKSKAAVGEPGIVMTPPKKRLN